MSGSTTADVVLLLQKAPSSQVGDRLRREICQWAGCPSALQALRAIRFRDSGDLCSEFASALLDDLFEAALDAESLTLEQVALQLLADDVNSP